ncbi:hypothetical protein LBMAG49_25780 [Planctomycetota bacterium]|nr:hypothetical protein LBMAG49_25780 [Planctomycetota bacterium]
MLNDTLLSFTGNGPKPGKERNDSKSYSPVKGTSLAGMLTLPPWEQPLNKNANGKKNRATQLPDKIVTRKILAAEWWSL